jgi:hypothetical protein
MYKNLQQHNFVDSYAGLPGGIPELKAAKQVRFQQFDGKQITFSHNDLYRHIETESHQIRSMLHKMRGAELDPDLREIVWLLADKADALTKMIRQI